MKKTPALSLSLRQRIAKYKERNPLAKISEVADQFNVTYDQARKAVADYKKGLLNRSKPRKKKSIDLSEAMETPADKILEIQYHTAAAQLEISSDLAVDERIAMLDKLFTMRKTLQQVRLENHIKRVDASVFSALVRKFKPDADDEEVIKYYREIIEELKL